MHSFKVLSMRQATVKATLGRPKDIEKGKQILATAKAVFLKHGYHGTSMNQIAKEAGVTKLTIYNHFQDKENLFVCAIEQSCEAAMQAQPFQLEQKNHFQQALFKACQVTLEVIYLPEAIKLEWLLMSLAAEKSPLLDQFYLASHTRMRTLWQDFFNQAIDLQCFNTKDTQSAIELMLSLILGVRHHEVLLGVREVPDASQIQNIIQQSIDIFLLKYPLLD